jgi:hypothetical protein
MRSALIVLFILASSFSIPVYGCLNDVTTPLQEEEFRAGYKDLPPAPVSAETSSMLTSAGGLALGLSGSLLAVAIVWRILQDRA